jgi:hypothetical protein
MPEFDLKEFARTMDGLIDGWCERRKLGPLRYILRAYPVASGLTDEWEELRAALRHIRSSCRDDLEPQELDTVVALIHQADRALER